MKHEVSGTCAPCQSMKPGLKQEYDAFLQFIPTGAHCVLPRWRQATPSSNLARDSSPAGTKVNTDQPPDTDNAAERGKSGRAARPMGTGQALREIRKGIVVMWWSF